MISYKIVSRHISNPDNHKRDRKKYDPASPTYKEDYLERIVKTMRWHRGHRCRIAGTTRKGVIHYIEYDPNKCLWKDNKPYFIHLIMDDGGQDYWVHPDQITYKRL